MDDNKTLYTITIFSENTVGVLNQITTIFTRRQLNIETLSVSPSAIKGIHKFTITTFTDDENVMKKLVSLIDKRVDILKAYYNTDEDLVHQERPCINSQPKVLAHGSISTWCASITCAYWKFRTAVSCSSKQDTTKRHRVSLRNSPKALVYCSLCDLVELPSPNRRWSD